MLSQQEKREMLEDGKDPGRRKRFIEAQRKLAKGRDLKPLQPSLDEFIQFLLEVQEIFSPFVISRKKTVITNSKL